MHIFRNICTTFSQIWCDLRGFNRAKREKNCNLGPSGTYSPPFAPISSLRPLRKGPPLRFSALPQNPRRRGPGPPEPPPPVSAPGVECCCDVVTGAVLSGGSGDGGQRKEGALGYYAKKERMEKGGANSSIADQSDADTLEVNQSLPNPPASMHRLTNLLRCLRPFPAKSVPNSRC